jgi:phosphoglycolate phosphatase
MRLAIFDLDGTLIDSLRDIAEAMNAALVAHGMAPCPVDDYKQYVGEGVTKLAEKVVPPEAQNQIPSILATYRDTYARGLLIHTQLYDGIPALLDGLRDKNISLAILSNKPHAATSTLARHFFGRWPFGAIRGESPEFPRKPDPLSALDIAAKLGALPADTLFIGDSAIDMQTAVRAGMFPVGVLWGFRDEAELREAGARALLRTPGELLTQSLL